MGLKETFGGVGLVILFIISMLYFMTAFIQTNNPDGFNPAPNTPLGSLNSSLTTLNAKAQQIQDVGEEVKHTLESETPSPIFLFLIIYSAFTIPIAFVSFLVSGVFAVITILYTSLFGAGSSFVGSTSEFYIVFTVVSGLLLVGVVFAILKAIRLGQTER